MAASLKACRKLNVKARDLILYTDLPMCALYKKLSLCDERSYQHETNCFGKIRYLSLTYKKNCDGVLPHFLYFFIWDFCTRPAFNGLWEHIQMLTKCTKFMTQSLNCIFLYTVCFGILIVSLNTTFYLFFSCIH